MGKIFSGYCIAFMLIMKTLAETGKMRPLPNEAGINDWEYFRLDDNAFLRVEDEARPSKLNPGRKAFATRLYHYPENGSPQLIWEEKHDSILWDVHIVYEVSSARRFGDVFCVVLRNVVGGDRVDFLRVDMSKSPPDTLRLDAQTPRRKQDVPAVTIESPHDFSYVGEGGEKISFRVFDDGRLERNGIPYPTFAFVNGKALGEESSPGNPAAKSPIIGGAQSWSHDIRGGSKSGNAVSKGDPKTDDSAALKSNWLFWGSIAVATAAVAGWLLSVLVKNKR